MFGWNVNPKTLSDAREFKEANTLWGALKVFAKFPTPRILLVSLAVWFPFRVFVGAWSVYDFVILAAISVYWPFQEWFAHIFLLHLKPRKMMGLQVDPYFAKVHRWHHGNPNIIERIFVPWQVILLLTPINIGLWYVVTPTTSLALSGILFFTLAALLYEWVHFLVHMPYLPKTQYFKKVRNNHCLHHFKNEHYWHAFTGPWIDEIMGTSPDPRDVSRSDTVHTLGVDDDFSKENS